MIRAIPLSITLSGLFFSVAPAQSDPKKDVASNYADIAYQTYGDALATAKKMQAALAALVTAPNQLAHIDARIAWIEARPPYLQSEVFRFYGGPIDKLETAINGPADPAAINAFVGGTGEITPETVGGVAGGTGYHAIEYLLWGEDKAIDGPGERTFADYTGESPDATRRGKYLRAASELLTAQLQSLVDAWDPAKEGNFRALFTGADSAAVLQRIFTGVERLATREIAANRLRGPLASRKGGDEQSPYSDTTHIDILHSTAGLANVLAGAYIGVDGQIKAQGASPIELAEKTDPAVAEKLKNATNLALQKARRIGKPFDQAILQPENSAVHDNLVACADSIAAVGAEVRVLAEALGVPLAE